MKMRRCLISALALCSLVAGVAMSGCIADTDGPGDERVGEAQGAWGGSACCTDTNCPAGTCAVDSHTWSTGTIGDMAQSTLNYGDTVCPQAFRVQYANNPSPSTCTVHAYWNDSRVPTTSSSCTQSFVEVQVMDSGCKTTSVKVFGQWVSNACVLPGAAGNTVTINGQNAALSVARAMLYNPLVPLVLVNVKTQMTC